MKNLFDFVLGISLEIWDTSQVGVDGVGLRLVERKPWQVYVMWPLRVSPVVGW